MLTDAEDHPGPTQLQSPPVTLPGAHGATIPSTTGLLAIEYLVLHMYYIIGGFVTPARVRSSLRAEHHVRYE